jgi:hypothetical protein
MLTSLLGTSKQLVTALEKVDWLGPDLALTLLALVILFILKQRLVGRRLRIAFGGHVYRISCLPWAQATRNWSLAES